MSAIIPDEQAKLQEVSTEVSAVVARARAIEVQTPEQARDATAFLSELKAAKDRAERARHFLVDPLNAHVKTINDRVKGDLTPLVKADQLVRVKVSTYLHEQQVARAQEQICADPSTVPGGMECKLRREVFGGTIEYFEAEVGWLTQAGTPRQRAHRAYKWTPKEGDPKNLPSVSYICDQVCPKPGLAHYAEARGIEGTVIAMKAGLVYEESRAEDAIALVREHGLGAEAAKNRAATRGLNVHAINEHFLLTGEAPRPGDHPEHHRGYIRSWAKMVLALNPEPLAVEQLVVNGDDSYAGRLDLRARVRGVLELDDLKTQENGALYPQAHIQTALYERAAVWCGDEPAERLRAIVLPANGDWNEEQHSVIVNLKGWQVDAALAWWRAKRPIDSACESRNRKVRG